MSLILTWSQEFFLSFLVLDFFFINIFTPKSILYSHIYVVVQFYPWFEFYFRLFLGVLMYENEFERKEKKI